MLTTYARLTQDLLSVDAIIARDSVEVASLSLNKQAMLRPLIVDSQPTPTATQVVVNTGYVIEPDKVRQTWALRDKTAEELEADSLVADRPQIVAALDALNTQLAITNAQVDAMTNTQLRNLVRDDRRIILQVLKYIVRKVKQGALT